MKARLIVGVDGTPTPRVGDAEALLLREIQQVGLVVSELAGYSVFDRLICESVVTLEAKLASEKMRQWLDAQRYWLSRLLQDQHPFLLSLSTRTQADDRDPTHQSLNWGLCACH